MGSFLLISTEAVFEHFPVKEKNHTKIKKSFGQFLQALTLTPHPIVHLKIDLIEI